MIDAHELGNIDIIRRLIKGQTDYVNVTNVTSYGSVYTGLVGTGTTGTNVTMTLNSNGLALSVNPGGGAGGAAIQGSGTYSQNSGTVQFANSNNITFGLSSDGIMTASFSVTGAYLTTAMASDAGSLYQSAGAYLTTAMASDAGSLYQSAGAYLTTAMASDAGSLYQSAGAYLTTGAESDHTHSDLYQITGAYLTTAMASGDGTRFMGLNTAVTGASMTGNSSGMSINIPQGSLYLNDANGITFGASVSDISTSITASYNSTQFLTTAAASGHTHSDIYQSTGAYLTTAAQVSHDHGSINWSATSNSTETIIRLTTNSSGWTIVHPSFLTTAAVSGHTHSDLYLAKGDSSAFQTATLASTFAQTANVMLTGERANYFYSSANTFANSTHAHGNISISATSNATETAIRMTSASSGFTFVQPSFLTTAAASGHTHSDIYPPIAGTTAYNISVLDDSLALISHSHGSINISATSNATETAMRFTSNSSGWTIVQPSFITTAALSNHDHTNKLGSGTTIATTSGVILKVTANSDGLNISYPAAITTGALSDHTHGVFSISATSNSTETAIRITSASTGFTFVQPSFITTAAASGHIHSDKAGIGTSLTTTAGTDFLYTLNTDGLSIKIPKYVTTGGGGDWGTATTTGTAILITTGAATNTLYYPKYLTTATAVSAGNLYYADANGITWGSSVDGSSTSVTASVDIGSLYQTAGAYLTTAAQVSHSHGSINISATSNATETAMRFTSNSSGWTIVQPSFITTAAASGHTHSDLYPALADSTAYNTSVLSVTLMNTSMSNSFMRSWELEGNNTAGTTGSLQSSILYLSGGNGITLSGNSNTIVISAAGGNALSWYAPMPYQGVTKSFEASSTNWVVYPFVVPYKLEMDCVRLLITCADSPATTTGATVDGATYSANVVIRDYAVIYSKGVAANSRSLQYICSGEASISQEWSIQFRGAGSGSQWSGYSGVYFPSEFGTARISVSQTEERSSNAGYSVRNTWSANYLGYKYMDIPLVTTLNPGNYWIAFGASKTSYTNSAAATRLLSISHNGGSTVGITGANLAIGEWGQLTNATNNSWTHAAGLWTTNAQGTTNSINMAQVSTSASHNQPYFVFLRSA